MSSHNVKVDWGAQGGGKRRHTREVGNAKAMGPSEFGPLKGTMAGPAYGIRSSCVTAYKERNPQQQVAWCNNIIARARAMGIIKSEDPFAEAKRLRAEADKATGAVRADFLRRAEKIESVPDGGMSLDNCLAFAALAARLPEAHLLDFALAHKGAEFASHCYTEAAKPKWNVVRWATKEENAAMVTIGESLASGAALPGLMGKVAAELAAASASAKPAPAPAPAPAEPAPKPLTKRERYQAFSPESKSRWRRLLCLKRPKWTAAWNDIHGDHSLPEAVISHFFHMRDEAQDDLEHAQRYYEKDLAYIAELRSAFYLADLGYDLAKVFPRWIALLHFSRGTLEHPSVTAKKAVAKKAHQKQRRLNGKERAAAEKAALAAIRALPTYIAPLAAEAYMQPKEQIRSLSFKNLPRATNFNEVRALSKALSELVERSGASVSRERYALNIPTQKFGPEKGHTRGFGFVECTAAAGAQRVLAAAGARGTLDLEFNGITNQVFVELAAINRQSKADWEAAKAKVTAVKTAAQAKCRALVLATLRPATKVELAEEAPAPATAAAAVPVLAKVCLGATAKARREAEAAAEAARLKAEVQAMFSAPLGGILYSTPKAPQFKQSFAKAAKKGATAAVVVVVDEFTVKVDGVVKRVEAAPSTELGAAQSAIRRIMAADTAKAKKAARDKAYAQWAKDKAEAEAEGWFVDDWVEPA